MKTFENDNGRIFFVNEKRYLDKRYHWTTSDGKETWTDCPNMKNAERTIPKLAARKKVSVVSIREGGYVQPGIGELEIGELFREDENAELI